MFKRLANWLSLTPTERRVLLFLAGTLIAGAAIRAVQETFPPEQNFDYRAIDSSFAAYRARLTADSAKPAVAATDHPLNLNTATAAELLSLPGIGKTIAERIVKQRDVVGKFASVEDLLIVKGISKKKLEKLKPFISVQ